MFVHSMFTELQFKFLQSKDSSPFCCGGEGGGVVQMRPQKPRLYVTVNWHDRFHPAKTTSAEWWIIWMFLVHLRIFHSYRDGTIANRLATNLDLCLAFMTFSNEDFFFIFQRMFWYETPFLRSYPEEPWFSLLNAKLWRRSNRYLFRCGHTPGHEARTQPFRHHNRSWAPSTGLIVNFAALYWQWYVNTPYESKLPKRGAKQFI
jgi:hypothetical protein